MNQILPALCHKLCDPGREFPIIKGIAVFSSNHKPIRHRIWEWVYNRSAFSYDFGVRFAWRFSFGGAPIRRESYLSKLVIKPGSLVLETAVGTGDNILQLPEDAIYVGIDQSFSMLRRCQYKLLQQNRTAGLIQADMAKLPFLPNSFDHVFHVGGLQFMQNPAKGIDEMHRVAKAGATILLADESASLAGILRRSKATKIDQFIPTDASHVEIDTISNGELFMINYKKSGRTS
jgi:ubiquinone/menaquinone biosynthesis C-methylase UbiE